MRSKNKKDKEKPREPLTTILKNPITFDVPVNGGKQAINIFVHHFIH